jgi:hypothetical protein
MTLEMLLKTPVEVICHPGIKNPVRLIGEDIHIVGRHFLLP